MADESKLPAKTQQLPAIDGITGAAEVDKRTPDEKISDAKWSFDLKRFKAHLDGSDTLQVILRGHLYLEHVLIEFLKEAFLQPGAVDIRRIPYGMKIDLCVALVGLPKDLVGPLNKVNEFRNRAAHNLDYVVTAQDKRDFYNCFSAMGKELIDERGEPGKKFALDDISLGHMIKVIIVLLDIHRQHYVQWKRQREEAFANARRVLDKIDGTLSRLDGKQL